MLKNLLKSKTAIRFRPLWLSAIIVLTVTAVLSKAEVLLINSEEVGANVAIFLLWWLIIGFAIYRFEKVKNKRRLLLHIGTLLSMLGGILITADYSDMADNPVSIGLLLAIWLYIFHLLAPSFFRKYRMAIIGLYSLIFIIFAYARLSFDQYFEYHEEFILAFFWPIPVLSLLWIYEQWKWFRSLQSAKTKAELELLKSQINPHFFFNTLNNLHALTINQAKEAPDVIVKLSDMMRYTIYEGKKDLVPISDELSYLHNYIELHQIRQHQKVNITFVDEIKEDVMVAPLLFIVLLENAFKHGAERMLEDASIDIQLTATTEQIDFRIRNNYDPEEISEHQGIGLDNLQRRLELTYPDRYELKLNKEDNYYEAQLIIEP